jgi:malate dehydrogenase (oxaloacetate-decarboxylating)(NADP+)
MDIPVFHDDQHGTAIIAVAGLINALHLTGRDIKDHQACLQWRRRGGHRLYRTDQGLWACPENITLCDTKGVIYKGRTEGMNQWKSAHAVETEARSLADAMEGADVFSACRSKAR